MDLPVLRKCCFCVPLRYGLLTWGYLKLAAALVTLSFYIFFMVLFKKYLVSNPILITIVSLIAVLLAMEIVLHIIIIIGSHKKNVMLLQAYFIYAAFMLIVTIIMSLVGIGFMVISHGPNEAILFTVLIVSFVLSIVTQTFLVLSLRSEIIKLRSSCPYKFVKNENDPEGTMNSGKDEEKMAIDNGKIRIL